MQSSYILSIPMLHALEHKYSGITQAVMAMCPAPAPLQKPKVPSKSVGQPTAWGDFTKKVCAEQAEALAAFKAAAESKAGVMPKFMAVYRKSNPDEWTSFQEQWLLKNPKAEVVAAAPKPEEAAAPKPEEAAAPKPEDAAAPKPEEAAAPKPKKVLSPEHLAKMKAGREAKKAAAAAGGGEKLWHSNLTNQQLRDIYNPLLGKPMGLKNSDSATPDKKTLIAEIERLRAAPAQHDPLAEDTEPEEAAPAPVPVLAEKKKRGPKKQSDMTPDELAAYKAKKAAKAAKKADERSQSPPVERSQSPKIKAE